MATHFLDAFVQALGTDQEVDGGAGLINQPWYNKYGDCVEFRACGDAYYAERIDGFLTIYRHFEDERPVGFQVKGVLTLLKTFPFERLRIEAEVSEDRLTKISLDQLLLLAFQQGSDDNGCRLAGYSSAFNARQSFDEIEVTSHT